MAPIARPMIEGKGLPRLTRRPEFLAVAGSGRRSVTPGLVLQARPRADAPNQSAEAAEARSSVPRFGFTATRKIGGAVVRNRARRRLKAAAQLLGARCAKPGVDYVLIARAGTVSRPWTKLLRDLEQAFARVLEDRAAGAAP